MIAARHFALAQVRVQAHLARLPGEADWQRLAATRTLAAFLEEARTTPFADWVRGFSGRSDAHELERGLRAQFRDRVDAAARWVPSAWREAVSWLRWLPCLPLLAELVRQGTVPRWAREDFLLRALLDDTGEPSPAALARTGLAPLLPPGGEPTTRVDLVECWLSEWQARWPASPAAVRAGLERLIAMFVGTASPQGRSTAARRELRRRLHGRVHRDLLQPVTVFTFLALVGLDLERLRAELLTRALFAEGPA